MELAVETGPEVGRRIEISLGREVTIGRDESCELRLDDPKVSRKHARISLDGVSLEIVDLTSVNGTFVNGERVASARLSDGDRLRVGTTELGVHESVFGSAPKTLFAEGSQLDVEGDVPGSAPSPPPIVEPASGTPVVVERSRTAQVGLIFGIVGVVCAFTWPFFGLLFFPGLICSIVAIVLGIVALVKIRKRPRPGGRRAAVGLILGIVGFFVTGLFALLIIVAAAGSGASFG